jgi:hypothetical protein
MVAAALSSGSATSVSAPALLLTTAAARQVIYDQYTPWVQATYGDSAKTKTITAKKYARIVALLKVSEKDSVSEATGATSEAAKFRLWVKSKGFHLGPPLGHPEFGKRDKEDDLYLPTGTDKVRVSIARGCCRSVVESLPMSFTWKGLPPHLSVAAPDSRRPPFPLSQALLALICPAFQLSTCRAQAHTYSAEAIKFPFNLIKGPIFTLNKFASTSCGELLDVGSHNTGY